MEDENPGEEGEVPDQEPPTECDQWLSQHSTIAAGFGRTEQSNLGAEEGGRTGADRRVEGEGHRIAAEEQVNRTAGEERRTAEGEGHRIVEEEGSCIAEEEEHRTVGRRHRTLGCLGVEELAHALRKCSCGKNVLSWPWG